MDCNEHRKAKSRDNFKEGQGERRTYHTTRHDKGIKANIESEPGAGKK